MTDVLIKRELLELSLNGDEQQQAKARNKLREQLAAARQPEREGLEVVAWLGGNGFHTEEKEATGAPFPLCRLSDAQRAIAELRDRLDVMTQCADNHSRMFEESAEELDAAREILAQQGRRNTDLRAERDTLRQQLAELRDMLSGEVETNIPLRQKAFDLTEQRDKLADILRDLVPGCKWRFMRPRIDAALAEIDHGNE